MTDVTSSGYALGIDLGGSSAKSVAVKLDGTVLDRQQSDFDPAIPMQWAERVRGLVSTHTQELGGNAVSIGLAAPGLAARDERSISFMPGRLQGLEGLNWTKFLNQPKPVPVINDAHAALLGEVWVGAARGLQNVILITLGTGVGGAAMVDGRLLRGEIGRAGHLGHASLDPWGAPDICGTPGSLEQSMGNCSIHQRSNGRFPTTHDLVNAYRDHDPEATRIWLESIRRLAAAICSFINILDPAAVILGGGISRSGPALFDPLQKHLNEMEWRPGGHRVNVLPATLGEFAGALGAARQGILGVKPMRA